MQTINHVCRLLRLHSGSNMGDFAEKIGYAKSYVSEMESGKRPISMKVLEKYANVFQVSQSEILKQAENLGEKEVSEIDSTQYDLAFEWLSVLISHLPLRN